MFADRIKTPRLLMHGEQDHNVPFRQSMEMYYARRRLGKDVKWVAYTHGGHGMPTSTTCSWCRSTGASGGTSRGSERWRWIRSLWRP